MTRELLALARDVAHWLAEEVRAYAAEVREWAS